MKQHQLFVTSIAFFLSFFLSFDHLYAQKTLNSKEITKAVDSIFADKNSITVPGASVIIMKGEKVLLTKNYGAANLEFGVPFDENTVFPIEGFTEQLVIFSILKFEKEGLISLGDPVNKYLSEFGFPVQVSISHLMNHSSDFPMLSSLRLLAGWKYSDPFTHDDFMSLSKRVSSDLKPDREIIHNHGGIKILMMIIEKVSKSSFSEFATTNIFKPLGMTNTVIKDEHFHDSKNHTVGYTQSDAGYAKAFSVPFEIMCPNTYTTQIDFQKWMAIVQSKKFNGAFFERMNESPSIKGKLQERTYGEYCIGQQQYRHYLGQDEFYMRETVNGHSWMWLRLTQSKLSVMAVGNLDTYIGSKVNEIADLLGEYNIPVSSDTEASPIKLSKADLELCVGKYWNEKYYS